MTKEDLVPFELAKKLKDKGFNCQCHLYYTVDGEIESTKIQMNHNYGSDISCPTIWEAKKWLLKEHFINAQIEGFIFFNDEEEMRESELNWKYELYEASDLSYSKIKDCEYSYDTEEEALIEGINDALNLI